MFKVGINLLLVLVISIIIISTYVFYFMNFTMTARMKILVRYTHSQYYNNFAI